jgi:hypothetical protein
MPGGHISRGVPGGRGLWRRGVVVPSVNRAGAPSERSGPRELSPRLSAPVPRLRSARTSRVCVVHCRRRWSGTLRDRGNGRCPYRRGRQREHMHSGTEHTVPGLAGSPYLARSQRTRAARTAISRRRSGVSWTARASPPSRPALFTSMAFLRTERPLNRQGVRPTPRTIPAGKGAADVVGTRSSSIRSRVPASAVTSSSSLRSFLLARTGSESCLESRKALPLHGDLR